MKKLENLLENKVRLIEDYLCELICDDFIIGSIDRQEGVLSIKKEKTDNQVVDSWV